MIENNTGYPTSELISRIYTGAFLPFNFAPKYLRTETNQEKIDIFYNIGSFNNNLYLIQNGFLKKEILIEELKFLDNFTNAIKNPTEKTKNSANHYLTWFKMCCYLKFLLKDKGLDYFKKFSALSKKYNEKECEKFFEKCNPTFGSIPAVFSLIDKYIPPDPELERKSLIKKLYYKKDA